jgi:hypothetical protein
VVGLLALDELIQLPEKPPLILGFHPGKAGEQLSVQDPRIGPTPTNPPIHEEEGPLQRTSEGISNVLNEFAVTLGMCQIDVAPAIYRRWDQIPKRNRHGLHDSLRHGY